MEEEESQPGRKELEQRKEGGNEGGGVCASGPGGDKRECLLSGRERLFLLLLPTPLHSKQACEKTKMLFKKKQKHLTTSRYAI